MKYMKVNEIREKYLKFFEEKGHLKLKSFSLIPENDKSLLLISAGMAPLKPFFTGIQKPPSKRVTTCQKCIRTGDIENAGLTARHCTFFEMLGNFSFGDYFKEDSIKYAWEFLTKVIEIPREKLYVTVYEEDDEALELWDKNTNIGRERIFKLGKEDNFWEIGVGPCGPSSEIHYDRNAGEITTREEFEKASEEGKIVEIWNLVFTQFDKDEDGNYNKLKNPNIDTGMGLERLACVVQNVETVAEIDTVKSILEKISLVCSTKYGTDKKIDIAQRVISDHIKSVVFMINDGVIPTNEGRGYVLRRLLRRAARYGKLIGVKGTFLDKLVDVVVDNYACEYEELSEKREYIREVIKIEEEKFINTIDQGIFLLQDYMEKSKDKKLDGEKAFKLYDTFGFPVELTVEMAGENGFEVDLVGFKERMEEQRKTARGARSATNYMGNEDSILNKVLNDGQYEFTGYFETKGCGNLKHIVKDNKEVDVLNKGEEGQLIFDNTVFYGEKGGQASDIGIIKNKNGQCEVEACISTANNVIIHSVKVIEGEIKLNENYELLVNETNRKNITRNHSATHLLHEALTQILGDNVSQLGSFVASDRLRFDFNNAKPVTKEEIEKIEALVNQKIMETLEVVTEVKSQKEAKESKVKAQFEEKYGDTVRVVKMGEFSSEFCGGTHVKNTGEIGMFKITSESGISSGVRRIEAITGDNLMNLLKSYEEIIFKSSSILKTKNDELIKKIENIVKDNKEKDKKIEELNMEIAGSATDKLINSALNKNGINILVEGMKDIDVPTLRSLAEKLRSKLGENSLVLLLGVNEDKTNIVAMATKDINKAINCGSIVKKISEEIGGNGGGRPDMAMGGGKKIEDLNKHIEKYRNDIISMI